MRLSSAAAAASTSCPRHIPVAALRPYSKQNTANPPWLFVCISTGMVDRITNNLEHYMDLLSARQKLVASNIANVDTPGYKTKDLDFQFEFMSLTKGAAPNVVEAPGLAVKSDGNNVSMDREARLLAENALRFNLASSLVKAQLKMVSSAIQGGGNNG